MHIALLVLSALAGLSFWWIRLRAAGQAANEVVDAVGRARGAMRRRTIRRQAELSPITAIDDPVIAAATLIAALAGAQGSLSEPREGAIRREIGALTSHARAEEATLYAKWAAAQIDDVDTVINVLAPFLAARLDDEEKGQLAAMAQAVLAADGGAEAGAIHLPRMARKLGLVVA